MKQKFSYKDRDSWVILGITGLVILAINIALFQFLQKAIQETNYRNFIYNSKNIINEIQERLNNYEVLLKGAKGLFAASKSVEREEWKNYVNSLSVEEKYAGIQAVGLILNIPKEEINTHIEQVRQEGFANYKVWPEGERDQYSAIIYIEPFEGRNLRAFGYDMLTDNVRRQAMELSRDLNATVISSKIRLIQEMDVNVQNGFLMFIPVYKNGMPYETLAERRKNLLGFVYIPFRVEDFIWGILKTELSNVRLEIYDGSEMSKDKLFFDNKGDKTSADSINDLFVYQEKIPLFKNEWTIRVSSRIKKDIGTGPIHFIIFYIGGVVISGLLLGLVWLLVNNKKEAVRLAESITADLKRSEANLKAMNEASPLGIFMTDEAGKCVYTNTVYQNISGLTSEEALGDGWINSIHPEDRYQVIQQWKAYMVGKLMKYQSLHRFLRKNGTVAWTKVQAVNVKNGNDLLGYLGVVEDITEIKLQEGALLESEERAKLIIESALDAVVIIDESGRIVGWNNQTKQIFGWSQQEALGFKLEERIRFVKNEVISKEGFRSFVDKRKSFSLNNRFNLEVMHRDGHMMFVEVSISSIFINQREHFSIFIRDISEAKINEEINKQRNATMERMNKLMVNRELKMIELKKENQRLQDFQSNSNPSI